MKSNKFLWRYLKTNSLKWKFLIMLIIYKNLFYLFATIFIILLQIRELTEKFQTYEQQNLFLSLKQFYERNLICSFTIKHLYKMDASFYVLLGNIRYAMCFWRLNFPFLRKIICNHCTELSRTWQFMGKCYLKFMQSLMYVITRALF